MWTAFSTATAISNLSVIGHLSLSLAMITSSTKPHPLNIPLIPYPVAIETTTSKARPEASPAVAPNTPSAAIRSAKSTTNTRSFSIVSLHQFKLLLHDLVIGRINRHVQRLSPLLQDPSCYPRRQTQPH